MIKMDFSNAREVEQLRRMKELQKTKDEFVSVASHELRTPMTIIKSYLWLISTGRHGKLTKKQKRSLLSISRDTLLIGIN